MAQRQRGRRRSRRARPGLIDSVIDGASEIVQSVAIEVAPGVVGAIDVDQVIQRVDVQAVLEKVDMDELLTQIDVQALVDRLDIEQILARVDLNALLQRVDIDALVEQTELGSLIARSGSAVMAQSVDMVRSQGVGLDVFVHRWVDRLLRRDASTQPIAPPRLTPLTGSPT